LHDSHYHFEKDESLPADDEKPKQSAHSDKFYAPTNAWCRRKDFLILCGSGKDRS
jgi:hypothetical protein